MTISTLHARGIINFCQQPDAFLLLELRGGQARFFLEPGSVPVRTTFAEEAVRSGFLAGRDFDLFGRPMTWVYRPKPPPQKFPRPRSLREEGRPPHRSQ